MKQSLFESRHQPQWQAFAEHLKQLEQGKAKPDDVADFPHQYRRLCQHLALAQERGYSSYLVDPLQQLALRGHQQLYRHRSQLAANVLGFVLADFPRLVREQWRFVLIASLLFFGSLIGIALLVYLFPDLIYSIVSPQQVAEMQGMYDPDASRLGRAAERASSEDWMMFGYYVMHNIGIAFQTFAAGLLFGLGSVFFLIFNGLVIGAVSGHLTEIGYGQTFWSFVIGHGAFELTAIALAGAAGLQLGWALIAPRQLTRGESLRLAARKSVQMLCGVMIFLLIAAFIEAYWSSTTAITPWVKYLVGAVLWLLVIVYLSVAGRTHHAPE
ncbi:MULTISPECIES: stage II sporulation protein M [Pseudomonas fluorescens group]|uniref:Stage II sporulation protein M n=1 Tax=Pseudomonas petroselini TaxID=2899822 RepID=A0ABS8QT00_9PSED|nr:MULTISPECIES: stage II sporulation protein M [Pseudomonas fluorescens group]MCD7037532.1 stage II sporulation protein M [Pseudomonas petroselini]MCD7046767.1 stage II sporulation protein M [Pseudomonas petroselini]MCD7070306.1 stage II sporulation protein M [Pseudomonas petroselini]MCD7078103.1 stage II sporulation protein M [Pseudomonas petroselini]MCM2375873.1 stage II sporulation protein M [Pseudomonas marginalis]